MSSTTGTLEVLPRSQDLLTGEVAIAIGCAGCSQALFVREELGTRGQRQTRIDEVITAGEITGAPVAVRINSRTAEVNTDIACTGACAVPETLSLLKL